MRIIASLCFSFITAMSPWFEPSAVAELTAGQVMIIANRNNPASVKVADHYAERRDIPSSQIVTFDLPLDETMNRADYERRLLTPLRKVLEERNLHRSIRTLVTVYGVPLRVTAPALTTEEQHWRRDADHRLAAAKTALEGIQRQADRLAPATEGATPPPARKDAPLLAYERHLLFLSKVDERVQLAAKRIETLALPAGHRVSGSFEALLRQHQGSAGLAEWRHHQALKGVVPEEADATRTRALYAEALQLLSSALDLPLRTKRNEYYRDVERLYGAYGVYVLAMMELKLLSDEYADASVDSELSLLWWDRTMYGAAWRQPNPLYHANKKPAQRGRREIPLLMVSRLDGSTASIAARLVDQAMKAEQEGVAGTVYLDARGLNQLDTYGIYDKSLRDLDAFVSQQTTYRSLLENTETRFHRPGDAPDVALYVGWYRLRQYEDAFTFRPGAIGYHMASAEAMSLHNAEESGWCKNALEHGITATLGSTGEPYLDAFPEPLAFTALMLTGGYSLVESYYLTSRWVSWRMVLLGDPLYNPWKKKPAAKRSSLTMFSLAPMAPSDQDFQDPIAARAESLRLRDLARTRFELILSDQAISPDR